MTYQFRFDIVWSNFDVLMFGLRYTILLSLVAMVLGTVIGLTTAILRLRAPRFVAWPIILYVEIFRGTPALVQIVWIYYCLPIVAGINLPAFWSIVLAMALNSGAFLSEVFRAGIQAIDKGHIEAGLSVGMTRGQVTRRIVVPQATYRMIPAVGNVFIGAIKMSSLSSVLGMTELMRQGQILITNYFRPLEVFTVVAAIYFCMTYATSLFLIYLEHRLAWVKRERRSFLAHLRAARGQILRQAVER